MRPHGSVNTTGYVVSRKPNVNDVIGSRTRSSKPNIDAASVTSCSSMSNPLTLERLAAALDRLDQKPFIGTLRKVVRCP